MLEDHDEQFVTQKVEVCYARACIETEKGDFTLSLKYFRDGYDAWQQLDEMGRAKETGMDFPLVGGIANSLNGLGRNEESVLYFNQCLAMSKDKYSIYEVNRARCKWHQGDLKGASEDLEDFLERREKEFGVDDTNNFL